MITLIKYKQVSRSQFYTYYKNIDWADDVEELTHSCTGHNVYYIPKLKRHYILYPIYGNKETAFHFSHDLKTFQEGKEDTLFFIEIKNK